MSTPTTTILRPEDYGPALNGDSTASFERMFADADRRLRKDDGGGVPVSTVTIALSGSYRVSGTVMPPVAGRAQGLTIRGNGKRTTEIVQTSAKPLLINRDRWMGVRWHDLSFRSTSPGATYLDSYSTSTQGVQDWNWVNCVWRGSWLRGVGLDGDIKSNLNSEMVFDRCAVTGSFEDAFFHSGLSPQFDQQDQFLNFAFRDCKMEIAYGDILRYDKGGSINVTGGSWILKQARPDGSPSRMFYLPPGTHHNSVQSLVVTGVRMEPRDKANLVIESHWKGMVQFIGCMDDAWAHQAYAAADDYAPHQYFNPSGVRYQGCQVTGRHRVTQTEPPSRQSIVYDQCARTVASRRTKAAFLDLQGAYAKQVRIVHRDDRDGII
ncbi:hypothetical protein OS965_02405 [Streptomyces sp. H27-G5]|uniref:hypothetical protein n=1 Tax=Streptomyces sp. H27-G5 TaxID=2996698 RepID=UPI002270464D|nr:hypothetical protein [Streptomyces sp. H27-G5]MCY0917028.1 hypothetical protein [Streptomyces sp. H27-G5]